MTVIRMLGLFLFCGLAHIALAQESCEPSDDQSFICGATNPEDLVHVPGTDFVISSGMADGAGFYLIDAKSAGLTLLSFQAQHQASFANCATPPTPQTLNTHGLNIRATANGRARLYVVGHGAREAIEVFDVDATTGRPALTWIGCVPMPDGLAANSVASFADGSLVATVLFMPGTSFADAIVERKNTGAVFEWSPGQTGFTKIEGSELPANNGIEVSADGSEIYVASSGLQSVVAFSHANPTQQLRTTEPLPFTPDNVHLGPDGRLYTAGMANDVPECGGPPGPQHNLEVLAVCPRGTIAVAIDPETFESSVVVQTKATPSFSNATMVLPLGPEAWIGSFAGTRIARTPLLESGLPE
ncbi:MAG: hypothetical protein RLZZ227_1207 [Pseudomonadota bacterium]